MELVGASVRVALEAARRHGRRHPQARRPLAGRRAQHPLHLLRHRPRAAGHADAGLRRGHARRRRAQRPAARRHHRSAADADRRSRRRRIHLPAGAVRRDARAPSADHDAQQGALRRAHRGRRQDRLRAAGAGARQGRSRRRRHGAHARRETTWRAPCSSRAARSCGRWSALSVLLAALVWLSTRASISNPLKRLVEAIDDVTHGDLGRVILRERDDEVGDLADRFNDMTGSLREAREEILHGVDAKLALEARLRHSEKLATIGQLAAGIAHEVGTPLNVIGGRARQLEKKAVDPAEVAKNAGIIATQTQRITKIIQQLLDFARRPASTRTLVDLHAVAKDCLDFLEHQLATSRVDAKLRPFTIDSTRTDGSAVALLPPERRWCRATPISCSRSASTCASTPSRPCRRAARSSSPRARSSAAAPASTPPIPAATSCSRCPTPASASPSPIASASSSPSTRPSRATARRAAPASGSRSRSASSRTTTAGSRSTTAPRAAPSFACFCRLPRPAARENSAPPPLGSVLNSARPDGLRSQLRADPLRSSTQKRRIWVRGLLRMRLRQLLRWFVRFVMRVPAGGRAGMPAPASSSAASPQRCSPARWRRRGARSSRSRGIRELPDPAQQQLDRLRRHQGGAVQLRPRRRLRHRRLPRRDRRPPSRRASPVAPAEPCSVELRSGGRAQLACAGREAAEHCLSTAPTAERHAMT